MRFVLRNHARDERGFTLVELLVSMTILMSVMGGLTGLMVSGTRAQIDLQRRFEAQTEARLGLDTFRREVHCASSATTSAGPPARVTLTVATTCPNAAGNTSITWCTVQDGNHYGLWRYLGGACSGTGRRFADHLTTANAFVYTPPSGSTAAGTGQLAFVAITLDINLTPGNAERVYRLDDKIVLRNSTRPA